MSERLVRCVGLRRAYRTRSGSVDALHRLDVSFPTGGIVAIVGPSGSGKSTLLRLLAGLDTPTSGTLDVHGLRLDTMTAGELRRFRHDQVTYVTQKPADNLVPHLTIRQQVGDATDVRQVLTDLDVVQRIDARPDHLSGGEQARVAIAIAVLRSTPLVIADEPTAELDEGSAARVIALVRAARDRGTGFLFATHDEELIAAADTVVRLDQPLPPMKRERPANVAVSGGAFGLRGISKSYDGAVAVDHAELEVASGSLTVLLGRSGSGKSTLLMIAGGWQDADCGTVELGGVAVDPRDLAWSELAYVPQRFGLAPELTVRENVELPLRLGGLEADADQVLSELNLTPLADRFPSETSVGQQQRTALARALVAEPTLLLADEPTSHQDPVSRGIVWSVLRDAAIAGRTLLVATHDERAADYADRAYRIIDGRVTQA